MTSTVLPDRSANDRVYRPQPESYRWDSNFDSGRVPAMSFPAQAQRDGAASVPQPRTAVEPTSRTGVDPTRYWVGTMLTAVVSALAAAIGLVVARGILHIQVLGTTMTGTEIATYGLISAGLALAGGMLYFAMLNVAPRPALYYGWIVGLVTVLAVLLPFTSGAALLSAAALAGINLLIGLMILLLLPFAADSARTR